MVKFQFPNGTVLELVGENYMRYKGCIYHLIGVRDMDYETPIFESVLVVMHFKISQ